MSNDFAVVLSDRPTTPAAHHLPLRRVPRSHRGHLPRNLGERGKFETALYLQHVKFIVKDNEG